MAQSKNIKIIAGALILALFVFIGYKYLKGGDTDSDSDHALSTEKQNQTIVGFDVIVELRELNSIKLDDSIFENDVWKSFNDFTLDVIPEAQGRNNPFAPIGVEGGVAATSSLRTIR